MKSFEYILLVFGQLASILSAFGCLVSMILSLKDLRFYLTKMPPDSWNYWLFLFGCLFVFFYSLAMSVVFDRVRNLPSKW